jgi:hypothetical protein
MPLDLDELDGGFQPSIPKAEHLPEGLYALEITRTEYRIGEDAITLLVMLAPLDRPDLQREYALYWKADSPESAAHIGRELRVLGEDVDNWTISKGRPFSKELGLAAQRIIGARVRAQKRLKVHRSGRVLHSFFFLGLLGDEPVRPAPHAYLAGVDR